MVEHHVANVRVEGSNPFSRSIPNKPAARRTLIRLAIAVMASVLAASLAGCAAGPVEPEHAHSVFFAPDSAVPDEMSLDVLRALALEIAANRPRLVEIEAFANRRDDGGENIDLAARRGTAVAAALQASGVDPRLVTVTARGNAPSFAGLPVAGRRVDIRVRR